VGSPDFDTRPDLGLGVSVLGITFPSTFEVRWTDSGAPNLGLLFFVPTFGNAFSPLAIRSGAVRVQLAFDFIQDVILRCVRLNYASFRIVYFVVFLQHLPRLKNHGQFVFSLCRSDLNTGAVFWFESGPCEISCANWASEVHCGPLLAARQYFELNTGAPDLILVFSGVRFGT
jgi:hypothetical protein